MEINWVFYFLCDSIVSFIALLFLISVVYGIGDLLDIEIEDKEITLLFLFLLTIFINLISFNILSSSNIKPPTTFGKEISNSQSLKAFKNLAEVNKKLKNLDDLPLPEVINLLTETVKVSKEIENFATRQEQTITSLRNEVESAAKRVEEANRLVEEVKSITEPQLEAVKLLITEDANQAASKSFWWGVVVSLPVGIIASLTASLCSKYFKIVR